MDKLWEILDKYSETGLFRDWNDPKVNKLLGSFADELLEWAENG